MGYMGMGGPEGYGLKRVPILTTLAINYVRFLHDRSATSLKFLKKKIHRKLLFPRNHLKKLLSTRLSIKSLSNYVCGILILLLTRELILRYYAKKR